MNHLVSFRRRVLAWFQKHARPLPWRGTTDPYLVWVSEIMLQQTTTQTVQGYFDRFIQAFPTVTDLASAEPDQVSRLWEGLGYYRRCAQMHKAAQEILLHHDGRFPQTYEEIIRLPGIGRYTAGAILSIAFDQPYAILEANTIRLHARLTALREDPGQKESTARLWAFAEQILPQKKSGLFNQALMDLGSQICTARNPDCERCPIIEFCKTAQLGLQKEIPYPKEKAQKIPRTEVALYVQRRGKILLIRYPTGRRWARLWDFPRLESKETSEQAILHSPTLPEQFANITGRELQLQHILDSIKHVVTRYSIQLYFFKAVDLGKAILPKHQQPWETRWASIEEIRQLPMNSTARKLFEKNIDSATK